MINYWIFGEDNQDVNTIATGDTVLTSEQFIQTFLSTEEKILFADFIDVDSSTPTIKIEARFNYLSMWSDWVTIDPAAAVPRKAYITTYDKSWWKKSRGVQFRFTKVGAGAVTITSRWL